MAGCVFEVQRHSGSGDSVLTVHIVPYGESCWQCQVSDDAGELLFESRPYGGPNAKRLAKDAADVFLSRMPLDAATAQAGELF